MRTAASLSRAHQNGRIRGVGTPMSNGTSPTGAETFQSAPQAWAPCGAFGQSSRTGEFFLLSLRPLLAGGVGGHNHHW